MDGCCGGEIRAANIESYGKYCSSVGPVDHELRAGGRTGLTEILGQMGRLPGRAGSGWLMHDSEDLQSNLI